MFTPNHVVVVHQFFRANVQDDQFQYWKPEKPRNINNTWIGQELIEVAADGRGTGFVGCSKVDEYDAKFASTVWQGSVPVRECADYTRFASMWFV